MMKKYSEVFVVLSLVCLFFLMSILVLVGEMSMVSSSDGLLVKGTEKDVVISRVGVGNEGDDKQVTEKILADDARLLLIKNYLEKFHSPLFEYSELILELADLYEFDYRWIVAIAQQESNLCKKIPKDSYNCWGYGINSKGTLRFDNYDLALRSFAAYLKKSYFDEGLNTPELVMSRYCPHSNGSWAFGIRQFFGDIEAGK